MKPTAINKKNRIVVGIGDMKTSSFDGDLLKTYALGTCVGISAYDPVGRIGGLLHFQLPDSRRNPAGALENPYRYGDTGIGALFNEMFEMGARKNNLRVAVAGGADVSNGKSSFQLGRRNLVIAKRILWKNGIVVDAEDTGGNSWRTMSLDISSGILLIRTADGEYEVFKDTA